MELVSSNKCFGGTQNVYSHQSQVLGVPSMTFAVFLPPQAANGPVPALLYLSGLTCTHENVMTKGQYQQACAEAGIAFIAPNTSPRGEGCPMTTPMIWGRVLAFTSMRPRHHGQSISTWKATSLKNYCLCAAKSCPFCLMRLASRGTAWVDMAP